MTTHHTSSDLSTAEISIIIPIYNVKDTLRKCIESLQAQTCENWVAICVDDGSTDGSGELIDELTANDKRLKVIHKSNGGVSSARNLGLEQVTTPYVTMLDPDDWYEPTALEKALNAIMQNKCDMSMLAFKRIAPDNKIHLRCFKQPAAVCVYTATPLRIFQVPSRTAWGKVYKMSIIRKYDIHYPEDLKVDEDYYFNVIYWSHCSKYAAINEPLYNYLYSDTSVTKKYESGLCPYETYEGSLSVFRRAWEYIIQLKDKPYSNQDWCYSLLYGERTYSGYIFSCAIPQEWKRELTRYRRGTHALFAKDCSHWRIFLYKIKISGYFKFWGFVGWTKKYRVMVKNIIRGKRK